MCTTEQHDMTISDIARLIERPSYSVAYIIKTRNIAESRRVGIIRLFDAAAVEQIKAAAAEMSD